MDINRSAPSASAVATPAEQFSFNDDIRKIMQGSGDNAGLDLQRAIAAPNGNGVRLSDLPQDEAYDLLSARRAEVQNVAQETVASGHELTSSIDDVLKAMGISVGVAAADESSKSNDGFDPGLNSADLQDMRNTLSSKDGA